MNHQEPVPNKVYVAKYIQAESEREAIKRDIGRFYFSFNMCFPPILVYIPEQFVYVISTQFD